MFWFILFLKSMSLDANNFTLFVRQDKLYVFTLCYRICFRIGLQSKILPIILKSLIYVIKVFELCKLGNLHICMYLV